MNSTHRGISTIKIQLFIHVPSHRIVERCYVSRWMSMCLSVHQSYLSIRFSFPDDNLSKHQWIFTKLGMWIDIVEICFGIANKQVSSKFYGVLPETCPYFHFGMITWVNINGFSQNLVCALILWRFGLLGLLIGKFHQSLTELSARDTPIFSFSGR